MRVWLFADFSPVSQRRPAEARLGEGVGLQQRVYNTALEAHIHAYRDEGVTLKFAAQCKAWMQ